MVELSGLEASLGELAQLQAAGESTAELLRRAVEATTRMPTVSGAGLMLLDVEHALRCVAASDEAGTVLEVAQEEAGEGPCVEAFVRNEMVGTADVTAEPRWPLLTPLLRDGPVRAVLGVPVRIGGSAVGTLTVYTTRPHRWTDEETAGIGAFAGVVDVLLSTGVTQRRSDLLAQQLQFALDYRVVIERAVGYLMSRDGVDSVLALGELRSAARNSRRKVVDVGQDLLSGQPLPAWTGHLGKPA